MKPRTSGAELKRLLKAGWMLPDALAKVELLIAQKKIQKALPKKQKPVERNKKIMELRDKGLTIPDIARKLRLPYSMVYATLRYDNTLTLSPSNFPQIPTTSVGGRCVNCGTAIFNKVTGKIISKRYYQHYHGDVELHTAYFCNKERTRLENLANGYDSDLDQFGVSEAEMTEAKKLLDSLSKTK